MQAPRVEHWSVALRTIHYLKGVPGKVFFFLVLVIYIWLGGVPLIGPVVLWLDVRTITGWLIFLGHSPFSWKTKKQHFVSSSSAEAEYRSDPWLQPRLNWLGSRPVFRVLVLLVIALWLFFVIVNRHFILLKTLFSMSARTHWVRLSLCSGCYPKWYTCYLSHVY